jgi:glyoxylase-like metal-dependent hydrolase (beta-lactamase superfamily II)
MSRARLKSRSSYAARHQHISHRHLGDKDLDRYWSTLPLPSPPPLSLTSTGEDTSSAKYVEYLFDVIFPATETSSLSAILLSHGHSDHQGGVVDILKECERRGLPQPSVHKNIVPGGAYPARGFTAQHIRHRDIFEVAGARLHALCTPGHTDDHVAFILEVFFFASPSPLPPPP